MDCITFIAKPRRLPRSSSCGCGWRMEREQCSVSSPCAQPPGSPVLPRPSLRSPLSGHTLRKKMHVTYLSLFEVQQTQMTQRRCQVGEHCPCKVLGAAGLSPPRATLASPGSARWSQRKSSSPSHPLPCQPQYNQKVKLASRVSCTISTAKYLPGVLHFNEVKGLWVPV